MGKNLNPARTNWTRTQVLSKTKPVRKWKMCKSPNWTLSCKEPNRTRTQMS